MPLNASKVKSATELAFSPDEVLAAWLAAPLSPPGLREQGVQAVLFDLDGVLINTAEFHYRAWKQLADDLGIYFDRSINHGFRGVGRSDCLNKLLGEHARDFADSEKFVLAERKNAYYLAMVNTLGPRDVLPGARALAMQLKAANIRMALVSASKNARLVLLKTHMSDWFDAIVDGHDVTKSKPHPECFLKAARVLGVKPARCVVIEDAEAGVRAGHAAGCRCIAVGETDAEQYADAAVKSVAEVDVRLIEEVLAEAKVNRGPRALVRR